MMGPILIILCTLIWGTAFLAQKTGSDYFGPFTLTCYRNFLAGFFLLAVVVIRDRVTGRTFRAGWTRLAVVGGFFSGVVLFLAMSAQQLGIEKTTPGISAFLTANYILLVPVFAWIVGRGRPGWSVIFGVLLALGGSYFISVIPGAGIHIGSGELWTLLCAVLFAVQIMVVDRAAPHCDVLRFSMVEMFVAGIVAVPFLFLPSEATRLSWSNLATGWFPLFYVGILSSGVAYTLQNLGQARTPAALAAILMSFESVVGAVSGWLILHDAFSPRQLLGCVLVFAAILISQIPWARFFGIMRAHDSNEMIPNAALRQAATHDP